MSIVENAGFSHCKYLAVCKHINMIHRCTFVYFTMQAHSISLTFTHVNKGRYGDAKRTKQFNCLCITSKTIPDKSQQIPVLLGGKPRGSQTRGRQRQTDRFLHTINRKDKWTNKQHGQSGWILGKGGDRIWGVNR